MSETIPAMVQDVLVQASKKARETAVHAAWAQWGSLGAALTGSATAAAIIDPEALVLLSLAVEEEERRLGDAVAWGARTCADLISVQRMKTLTKTFPVCVGERVGKFAQVALDAGDSRWNSLAKAAGPLAGNRGTNVSALSPTRRERGPEGPNLATFPALMLKLRAGFGVSAKPDVLAFLIGSRGKKTTVQTITKAISYNKTTIHGSVRDMTRARFIQEVGEHPAHYYVNITAWAPLLELNIGNPQLRLYDDHEDGSRAMPATQISALPVWRYWSDLYAFLAGVIDLARRCEAEEVSPYIQSTRARDLLEVHHVAFTNNNITVPVPADYRGAAYLDAFEQTVSNLAAWVVQNV